MNRWASNGQERAKLSGGARAARGRWAAKKKTRSASISREDAKWRGDYRGARGTLSSKDDARAIISIDQKGVEKTRERRFNQET